jgi:molybdopterin molybdotransferase
VSTGDELVPVEATPRPGQIRDVNSHTLAGLLASAGLQAVRYGLVHDDTDAIAAALARGLEDNDAVLVSGGSSVGVRDLTIAAIGRLPDSEVLAHGVAVSPGKPTILARVGSGPGAKAVLGLPGQVTSAQVIVQVFCLPFFRHLAGDPAAFGRELSVPAALARNVASKPGREDYIRVRLEPTDGPLPTAHPVLGKSGLLRTLVEADGLVRIPAEAEGLAAGSRVRVLLL